MLVRMGGLFICWGPSPEAPRELAEHGFASFAAYTVAVLSPGETNLRQIKVFFYIPMSKLGGSV